LGENREAAEVALTPSPLAAPFATCVRDCWGFDCSYESSVSMHPGSAWPSNYSVPERR
jgi:hypothetical protein